MKKWKITPEYRHEWRQKNLDKRRAYEREWKRQYRLKHPDEIRKKRRERYHREKKNPEWHERHKAYMRAYLKKWRKNNPKQSKKHREWMRIWYKKNGKEIRKKRFSKLHERIASMLRSRINVALKTKAKKCARTTELIGTTIGHLKEHLEKQFKEGMTWENHGLYGWHCDHIRPLATFDLTSPEEQKKAFHYTNLQPLWAKDNLRKSKSLN